MEMACINSLMKPLTDFLLIKTNQVIINHMLFAPPHPTKKPSFRNWMNVQCSYIITICIRDEDVGQLQSTATVQRYHYQGNNINLQGTATQELLNRIYKASPTGLFCYCYWCGDIIQDRNLQDLWISTGRAACNQFTELINNAGSGGINYVEC